MSGVTPPSGSVHTDMGGVGAASGTADGSGQKQVVDQDSGGLTETKPCKICGNQIPSSANKCTECDEWQSRSIRLFVVQGKAVVTILPIVTLCIGFIAQLDGLWAEHLQGFPLSCGAQNESGIQRIFSGETLILSDLDEPVFLGPLKIGSNAGLSVLTQQLNGTEATQPLDSGPLPFSFTIAEETLAAVCDADQETFAVTATPLSLSASQKPIRLASCQC